MSWNHAMEYELPHWNSYCSGGGKGLFEKTYDLGARQYQCYCLHRLPAGARTATCRSAAAAGAHVTSRIPEHLETRG